MGLEMKLRNGKLRPIGWQLHRVCQPYYVWPHSARYSDVFDEVYYGIHAKIAKDRTQDNPFFRKIVIMQKDGWRIVYD